MSAAFYIVAEDNVRGLDLFVCGKALAKNEKILRKKANVIGVKDMMSFFSQNPEEAEGFFRTLFKAPPEVWFTAEEGLVTVRALIGIFTTETSPINNAIVSELREFEQVLERLKQEGIRWHLAVDY